MNHMRGEDLTPGDFAVLDQNWAEVNDHLDAMVFIIREHRKLGCHNWYCTSEEFSDVLSALEPHQAIQLLAGAIERLALVAALEDQPQLEG
jgi:hypothetical protein